jgi:hypothetical protein
MRHARYVGPAGTGRFCVFVWFGLVRVGLEHAVQRRVPAPRDLPEHLAVKVRPRPVRVPARLISEIKKKNQNTKLSKSLNRSLRSTHI